MHRDRDIYSSAVRAEMRLRRIHRRIEERPDRQVRKTYLAMLDVAERI